MDYFRELPQSTKSTMDDRSVCDLFEFDVDNTDALLQAYEELQSELETIVATLPSQHLNDIRLTVERDVIIPLLELHDLLCTEDLIPKDKAPRIPDYFLLQPELPYYEKSVT